jgi:hypothetical protein
MFSVPKSTKTGKEKYFPTSYKLQFAERQQNSNKLDALLKQEMPKIKS